MKTLKQQVEQQKPDGWVAPKGYSKTKCYQVWKNMKLRCYSPKASRYERYGGRGIGVCEEWRNDFHAFWRDMGEPPAGMQLDRVDNEKDYSKNNCRWVSRSENARNRPGLRMITINGETLCVRDWAKKVGIKEYVIDKRLRCGWPEDEAVLSPVRWGQKRRHRIRPVKLVFLDEENKDGE